MFVSVNLIYLSAYIKIFFLRNSFKVLLFLLITSFSIKAQHVTHDVGLFIGTGSIQTDYGQRNEFLSSYGNKVISVSLTHYFHLFHQDVRWNSNNYFKNHVMFKSEFNITTKENFKHHGKYIVGTSALAQQLKAMKGSISMVSFGFSLEYYLKDLLEYMVPYSDMKWNPYATIGFKYSFYENELTSDLGDWRTDITVLPVKYRAPGALAVGKGSAASFVLGFGTRYKLSERLDLSGIFNWQYFFSDAIDGLQANVPENKKNEFMINLQLGVIYHLNFSNSLFCK